MDQHTELLLTTPNAFSLKGLICTLLGREKVHPEHVCYFSCRTIQELLRRHGLASSQISYYQGVTGRGASLWLDRSLALTS